MNNVVSWPGEGKRDVTEAVYSWAKLRVPWVTSFMLFYFDWWCMNFFFFNNFDLCPNASNWSSSWIYSEAISCVSPPCPFSFLSFLKPFLLNPALNPVLYSYPWQTLDYFCSGLLGLFLNTLEFLLLLCQSQGWFRFLIVASELTRLLRISSDLPMAWSHFFPVPEPKPCESWVAGWKTLLLVAGW